MAVCEKKFFETIEKLIDANGITVDRPMGTCHQRYQNFVYTIDYGYINGTKSQDGQGIDVFIGQCAISGVVGIVCTIDSVKKDSEVKVLYKCDKNDIDTAMELLKNSGTNPILVLKI